MLFAGVGVFFWCERKRNGVVREVVPSGHRISGSAPVFPRPIPWPVTDQRGYFMSRFRSPDVTTYPETIPN